MGHCGGVVVEGSLWSIYIACDTRTIIHVSIHVSTDVSTNVSTDVSIHVSIHVFNDDLWTHFA